MSDNFESLSTAGGRIVDVVFLFNGPLYIVEE